MIIYKPVSSIINIKNMNVYNIITYIFKDPVNFNIIIVWPKAIYVNC